MRIKCINFNIFTNIENRIKKAFNKNYYLYSKNPCSIYWSKPYYSFRKTKFGREGNIVIPETTSFAVKISKEEIGYRIVIYSEHENRTFLLNPGIYSFDFILDEFERELENYVKRIKDNRERKLQKIKNYLEEI